MTAIFIKQANKHSIYCNVERHQKLPVLRGQNQLLRNTFQREQPHVAIAFAPNVPIEHPLDFHALHERNRSAMDLEDIVWNTPNVPFKWAVDELGEHHSTRPRHSTSTDSFSQP